MKFLIVFVALFALALAAPPASPASVNILKQAQDVKADGYSFLHQLDDGTTFTEQGELKNVNTENESLAVRGSFSWVAPDGETYTVTYVADENGFQPQGAHLPVGPA
ncbi:hypothetical protein KR044_011924 [Drosophila immigrans]|nr:hypothetical protein KR044_011924 [Drosophila immigrans]